MLPQSGNTHELLQELAENPPTPDFPLETVKELSTMIQALPEYHNIERNQLSMPFGHQIVITIKYLI